MSIVCVFDFGVGYAAVVFGFDVFDAVGVLLVVDDHTSVFAEFDDHVGFAEGVLVMCEVVFYLFGFGGWWEWFLDGED